MAGLETLTWSKGDAITAEKLQAMVQELRQLRVDSPELSIQEARNDTIVTNVGNSLKMIAGSTIVPSSPNSQQARVDVRFSAGVFSPGNSPIVTATLSTTDRIRTFCTVSGPGGTTQNPTDQGFMVTIAHQLLAPNEAGTVPEFTFALPQTVFWTAVGY